MTRWVHCRRTLSVFRLTAPPTVCDARFGVFDKRQRPWQKMAVGHAPDWHGRRAPRTREDSLPGGVPCSDADVMIYCSLRGITVAAPADSIQGCCFFLKRLRLFKSQMSLM